MHGANTMRLPGVHGGRGASRGSSAGSGAAEEPSAAASASLSDLLRELARAPGGRAASAWDVALWKGAVVGRFELVREIGRGGFGVVWEARDTELGRTVAFKALRVATAIPPRDERILREAELAARLAHPNIVTLYDAGICAHGPYLVLEHLRGRTLAERLQGGPVAPREAIRIVVEVAKGVAHAHARGVVHRDLKPANVFLCDDDQVKVLDFGLAHAFGHRKPPGGTTDYMAPEQRRGAPEDERTDVYALGAILYRLVTNAPHPPRPSDDRAGVSLDFPAVPALGPLVQRMLEEDPVQRPRDAGEVLDALSGILRQLDRLASAATPPAAPRRRRWPVRHAHAIRFAVVAAIAVAAALALPSSVRHRVASWVGHPLLPSEKTVAVLPFRDLGGTPADGALSAGLVELVTHELRRLERFRGSLRVVSPSDVLREEVASAKEARAAFGANLAITGTIQWQPDRIRVTADLVDARTLLVLAARTVHAPRGDAAALQRMLTADVADMLELELGPEARPGVSSGPPPAPGAYEFYLEGRGYLQRYDRAENLESAVAVFDQALARDPAYALAHAGKAEAFLRRYELTKDGRFLDRARESGRRAVELDDGLAVVQLTMGLVLGASGDHDGAIRSFEHAIELEPGSADAHRELARAYDAAGRTAQAEATYRRAIELRPSSWAAYKDLGVFYNRHERLGEALPMLQRVVALTPDNYAGYANLGGLYLRLGMHEQAAATLEKSLQLRSTAQGHANLGTVYFYEERFADAAREYGEAVALVPTDAQLWGDLADAERWAKAHEDAARDYRHAIDLLLEQIERERSDPELWSRLAVHQAALGRRADARASLARALGLGPRDAVVLFRAALVHADAGDLERTLSAVRAAVDAGYPKTFIRKAPPLAWVAGDPRFGALVGDESRSDPVNE